MINIEQSKSNSKNIPTGLLITTSIFVTALIVSNIIAFKLVDIFGFFLPAGLILFPISYIAGDILTEVYGLRIAQRVIWIGFASNLLAVIAILIAISLPGALIWEHQTAFEQVLKFTPRLLLASFLAYLAGEFSNSYLLVWIKQLTGEKWLWIRTIGSTIVGQGIDSAIFLVIAFAGILPPSETIRAIIGQWVFKSAYEALATPVTYAVINTLKKYEE